MGDEKELSASEVAAIELAANMVPFPEDQMSILGPLGALEFARLSLFECTKKWAAVVGETPEDEFDRDDPRAHTLDCLARAAGFVTEAAEWANLVEAEEPTEPPE